MMTRKSDTFFRLTITQDPAPTMTRTMVTTLNDAKMASTTMANMIMSHMTVMIMRLMELMIMVLMVMVLMTVMITRPGTRARVDFKLLSSLFRNSAAIPMRTTLDLNNFSTREAPTSPQDPSES